MDFENMKIGCPWKEGGPHHDDPERNEPETCQATGWPCAEYTCAPFHWIDELKNSLCFSISAEIR